MKLKPGAGLGWVALLAACGGGAAPLPPPGTPPELLALQNAAVLLTVGDIARCDASGDERTAALADSLLRADSAAGVPATLVTVGDNAYPAGSYQDFTRCFAPSWGSYPLILGAIHPAPGNHEYGANPEANGYFRYFGDRAGDPDKGYYSFDFQGWHIVVLNTQIVVGSEFSQKERQAQESWLEGDLQGHAAKCTIAVGHHPRFTSGPHGSDRRLEPLWAIMQREHVDIVVSGHDHHYERFAPQTPTGEADSTGIVEFVAGTGGGNLRAVRARPAPNSIWRLQGRYGLLKLTLGQGRYQWEFLDTAGRTLDAGEATCH